MTLSAKEIELFEGIAGEEMKYFGYVPDHENVSISTSHKVSYYIKDRQLAFDVQLKHLFTDKCSLRRVRRNIYLAYLRCKLFV